MYEARCEAARKVPMRTGDAMKASRVLQVVLASLLSLWATTAMAQDGDEAPPADAAAPDAAPVEEASTENPPGPTATDSETGATKEAVAEPTRPLMTSADDEVSRYWGKKRNLAVVQKRLFAKDGRLEFTVFGGIIPNDPFLTYIPVGGRFNYYFIESLSMEVAGSYTGTGVRVESDLAGFLKNNPNIKANTDLLDQPLWRASAAVVWSPFYGKMALANANLSHFDINLVAGLGVVQVESPTPDRSGFQTEIKPEGTLGAGMRFFLTDFMTLRMDYRQGIFQKAGGGVSTPSELTLGLSFFLGG